MLQHKFIHELSLLEKEQEFCGLQLKGTYDYLFIGTFEPDSKGGPIYNTSNWFYGYQTNRFWYVLPMILENKSLHSNDLILPKAELVKEWQKFCIRSKVIIIDLIKTISARGRLNDKSDTQLNEKLIQSGGNYSLFNFKDAFKNVTFNKIVFTRSNWRSGIGIDILAMIKKGGDQVLKKLLSHEGRIIAAHTPRAFSPDSSYNITREELLAIWRRQLGYPA